MYNLDKGCGLVLPSAAPVLGHNGPQRKQVDGSVWSSKGDACTVLHSLPRCHRHGSHLSDLALVVAGIPPACQRAAYLLLMI